MGVTLPGCPKLALCVIGVRLRSPMLFAVRLENLRTLAAPHYWIVTNHLHGFVIPGSLSLLLTLLTGAIRT